MSSLLLLSTSWLVAHQPLPLRDGQQVTLTGTLTMEPAGRLQFVTVKTTSSYVPMFKGEGGKETSGETLHEISIFGFADYSLLYAHRGQQITVTGKMTTDDITPYFWHGTRLQAVSIVMTDGVDLQGKFQGPWIPANTSEYRVEVTLPADLAAPWRYSLNGRSMEQEYLSCSSNGGGDVVNCFCAQSFHPTETRSSLQDSVWQGQVLNSMHLAQFQVGDDARAAVLSVMCSR